MGFSSGLPLALTSSSLQAWLKDEGLDLTTIGLFALVGLPYSLKFLWAPLFDHFAPPILGRRRAWIFLFQLLISMTIFGMSLIQPSNSLQMLACIALVLAFFSASQDTVIDAYRTEVLGKRESGLGAGLAVTGYRLAMLASGAGALIMADFMPWPRVFAGLSLIMLVLAISTLLAKEPVVEIKPRNLRDSVIKPLQDFFGRTGAYEILLFILLYKLGDVLAANLGTVFLLDIGFTKSEIGFVNKAFGLAATIGGAILGGTLMMHLGEKRSLWTFGILQAITILGFSLLARSGNSSHGLFIAVVALENFTGGMGTAAFSAFLMGLCNRHYTATQYALLTSLMAVPRTIVGSSTGKLAEYLGWQNFFIFCTLAAVPGLLMLLRFDNWNRNQPVES